MVNDMVPRWQEALDIKSLECLASVAAHGRGSYSQTIKSIMSEMLEWAKGQTWREKGKLETSRPVTPQEIRDWLTAKARNMTDLHFADVQSRVFFAGIDALKRGLSDAQVIDAMKAAVAEWATRGPQVSASIVVGEARNYQHDIARRKADCQGAQWCAALDNSCELCEYLDGMQVAIDDPVIDEYAPPLHPGCNCEWVWVMKDEAGFEPDWKDPPEELKKHMK